MLEQLTIGPVMTNCYLYWDDKIKVGVVVDPAGDCQRILEAIQAHKLKIEWILLTHTHYDHIGAVQELAEKTGAKIAVHALDAAGLTDPNVSLSAFSGYGGKQKAADVLLADGDIFTCGSLKFQVFHTPGHTRGGICIYSAPLLFSGDTLFHGDVGRCDLPGGDFDALKRSICEKLFVLPEETLVYPGHGQSSTIGYEKTHNPYLSENH